MSAWRSMILKLPIAGVRALDPVLFLHLKDCGGVLKSLVVYTEFQRTK